MEMVVPHLHSSGFIRFDELTEVAKNLGGGQPIFTLLEYL